jgi:hypothetical protein
MLSAEDGDILLDLFRMTASRPDEEIKEFN